MIVKWRTARSISPTTTSGRRGQCIEVFSAVVNHENGYMFIMPPQWVDQVTVVTTFVSNEWKFIRFNETLENDSDALLYINVYSEDEYKDRNTHQPADFGRYKGYI